MNTNPFHVGDRVLVTGIQSSLSRAVGRGGRLYSYRVTIA